MARLSSSQFDFVIIGAGSAACAAAHAARKLKKSVLMIEERKVGGTCLHYGCVPSKYLIEAAKVYQVSKDPRFRGLRASAMALNFQELISEKDDIIRHYYKIKCDGIKSDGITLKEGQAKFIDASTIDCDGEEIALSKVLIAAGATPVVPDIEGVKNVAYLTSDLLISDDKLELKELPRSLIIVGGGYIALELGQMFARFGTKVTLIERSPELLSKDYEPEVGQIISKQLKHEGINIIYNAQIEKIKQSNGGIESEVYSKVDSKTQKYKSEKILLATGRKPKIDGLNLVAAGVATTKEGSIHVDPFLQTSVPHIFAAGDAIGSQLGNKMATPVAVHDGILAVRNAFTQDGLRSVEHRVIPRTIFTDPEVAVVGITEAQAAKLGRKCRTLCIPISNVSRAVLSKHDVGIIKMIVDEQNSEVVGVTMVGHGAAEVIHEAAMGMRFHARVNDFAELIHVYPSMTEALRIVANA